MTEPILIPDTLARWVRERPDREALRFGEQHWSWAQLGERVGRVAGALRAAGLAPGTRIAVLDLNHPSCIELTLACAQVGAVNTVINFRLAPAEVAYVVNDAEAELLFVGPELAALVDGLVGRLSSVRRVIRVGGADDEYESWLADEPDHDIHPASPDDCFLQLYTSGTTGFPKGAMLTHRSVTAHSRTMATEVAAAADSSVLVAMPLFHVGGSSYALCAVYAGARVVLSRVPDPGQLLATLERERISHVFLVPALIAVLVRHADVRTHDYSALRTLSYGASPMPLSVLRAAMDLFPNVLQQVYGMTEAAGVVSALGPDEHADRANEHRLISAGKPIPGVRVEVRDPVTGRPVPTGEAGEICVFTEHLMSGYWNKPEASASAIGDDGWLRSGDGGYLDADGYLYITDRIKDMIISGGENVYPAEIERVLAEHPTVGDVAVIGVPDDRWGEVPKACVVPAPGASVDPDALLAYCREHLASYKCPKSVDLLDELPRNPTGKVLKKDLRKPYWKGRDRQV